MVLLTKFFLFIAGSALLAIVLLLMDIEKFERKHFALFGILLILVLIEDVGASTPLLLLGIYLLKLLYKRKKLKEVFIVFFAVPIVFAVIDISLIYIPFYYYSLTPFIVVLANVASKKYKR